MAQVTTTKQVTILHRYFMKATESVICEVLNGEGKKYKVGIHKSGNTTCTCKHGSFAGNHANCHHVKHVQEREAARTADKATTFAALMQQYDVRQVATPQVATPVCVAVVEAIQVVKCAELDNAYEVLAEARRREQAPLYGASGRGWSLTGGR